MRLPQLALALVACAQLVLAIPAPSSSLSVRDGLTVDDCPGYEATNVLESASGVTADLTLAGNACNVYGTDLKDLKLLVEYQSSKSQ